MSWLTLAACCAMPGISLGQNVPGAPVARNSASRLIDVTTADGTYVLEPLVRTDGYDQAVAVENSRRIRAIMTSANIGPDVKVFFPAGHYYFEGIGGDWLATMETTHPRQLFVGDGMNATQLHQADSAPQAMIKIKHSHCAIKDLSIVSSDYADRFKPEWDAKPHQAAIHLAAADKPWTKDPQIINVSINTTGNDIALTDYYRPFSQGIRITGAWLNIYVHTMFIRDVINAINIDQGQVMAGPAKFIDVNAYATLPPQPGTPQDSGSSTWNTFFKSEGQFMEQVELIHCTYIGSQFIYMDGSNSTNDNTPAFNMIVDHCYINTLWLPGGDEAKWSGIYMKLPPKPGGIVEGFGSELYTRAISFTNNTAAGKSPRDGSFLYIEGNIKQLVLSENQFASGGADHCIYVHPTTPLIAQEAAIEDIEISQNVFHDFRNPITIGDATLDPARQPAGVEQDQHQPGNDNSDTKKPLLVESILIIDNQVYNLPILAKGLRTTCFLDRARQITISGNAFAKTDGSAFVLRECSDIIFNGNSIPGFKGEADDGIHLVKCDNAILTGNIFKEFATGVRLTDSRNVSLTANHLTGCRTGFQLDRVRNLTLTGNQVHRCGTPLVVDTSNNVMATGNLLSSKTVKLQGKNENLSLQSQWQRKSNDK